jgi:hypothetical protein
MYPLRSLPDSWSLSGNYPCDPPDEFGFCRLSDRGRSAAIIRMEYTMGERNALPFDHPNEVQTEATWDEYSAVLGKFREWLTAAGNLRR